jgi:uncharacterized protein (DUF1015 family)
MPTIAPARFVRYADGTDLSAVVCPPYDVVDEAGRAVLEAKSPHNFVRLVLPREEPGDGPLDRYRRARARLDAWRAEGVLVQDAAPALLAVEHEFTDPVTGDVRRRRGLQALLALSPFSEGRILPHERTLSGPKADRLELMRAVGAHLSPIFVLFPDEKNEVLAPVAETFERPAAMRAVSGGAVHRAWRITEPATIARLQAALEGRTGYIADGHHRYETALRYRALAQEAGARTEGTPLDWIPAFLCGMSDPGLVILPTHRLVHSLAFDGESLRERAARFFRIEALDAALDSDAAVRAATARLAGAGGRAFVVAWPGGRGEVWTLRADAPLAEVAALPTVPALRGLDVVLLHAVVMEHLLGMSRASQEKQEFLRYEKDAPRAVERVRSGEARLACLLHPTAMQQVRDVAEAGEVMPQKSTFFYPKIVDGLGLQLLDEPA